MKFNELLLAFRDQPYFDFTSVSLFFRDESPARIRTALYRFAGEGKLVPLRRELYAFSSLYAKSALHAARVANIMYFPSYLSELWALGWYGIIPEKVMTLTSVTPRPTRTFTNAWGAYRYRSLKQTCFSGYIQTSILGSPTLVAEPEKALLDLWYLEGGDWTPSRMESMRFDPVPVNPARLEFLSVAFASKRIGRTVKNWQVYARGCGQGGPIL